MNGRKFSGKISELLDFDLLTNQNLARKEIFRNHRLENVLESIQRERLILNGVR